MKYKNLQAHEWYLKNKKKKQEYSHIYNETHKKEIAKQKKEYTSNPKVNERKSKYNKNYRKKNHDKLIRSRREYLRNWEKQKRFERNLKDFKILSKQSIVHNLSNSEYKRKLQAWAIIIRHNFKNKCVICFAPAKQSHHVIFRNKHPELSFNLNNGVSLCVDCHKEIHRLNGY